MRPRDCRELGFLFLQLHGTLAMAKIRQDKFPPGGLPYQYWTFLVHEFLGPTGFEGIHFVYAAHISEMPPYVNAASIHPTLEIAMAEAHAWVSMPLIPWDMCDACREFNYGPIAPRWNIYRGDNRILNPLTYFGPSIPQY